MKGHGEKQSQCRRARESMAGAESEGRGKLKRYPLRAALIFGVTDDQAEKGVGRKSKGVLEQRGRDRLTPGRRGTQMRVKKKKP